MLKIGILTYHYSVNYGAVLQAYGLYQFLCDRGYDVEFIDYRPDQARNSNLKYLYFRGQKLINPFLLISGTQKILKLRRFWQSKIKLSSKTYYSRQELSKANHNYDIVICGSDEIWNISDSMTKFGADTSYFLDFIASKYSRKISYAASFGYTTNLNEFKDKLCKLLQEFDEILVRDSNSVKLVTDCNLKSNKVLDPTFLADFTKIFVQPQVDKDYILLYGSFSKEQGKFIESLARAKNLDIISIGARPGNWKPPVNLIGVGPEEYLGYFSKASFVFTNYFHGVIFSIIFNKPFINFDRPGKSLKVKDLLKDFDLEDRILTEKNIYTVEIDSLLKMDFNLAKLEQKISESKNFLQQALEKTNS